MEANLVVQQVETAQYLPQEVAAELTGELVCYGRSVAGVEWKRWRPTRWRTRSTRWAEMTLVLVLM